MPGGSSIAASAILGASAQALRSADAGVETILVLGRPLLVIKKIGDGANSVVYHAINSYIEDLPREVAVKRSFFNEDDAARAHEEIDLMQALRDLHIVQCFTCEVVRVEGKLSVSAVMEYCSGGSLVRHMQGVSSLQRGTSLPEQMVLRIACCVVSALSYLHGQSPPIAHRDVKPENVLMLSLVDEDAVAGGAARLGSAGGRSQFKLCDFGSATTTAHHSTFKPDVLRIAEEIESKTTPAYRAPEMCDPWSGQRIDERVDVWALGVLLYYCLFFRLPFGDTALGVLNGTLEFPRESGAGGGGSLSLRESLKRLVKLCLVRSPERRPSIFDVVRAMQTDSELGPAGAAVFSFTCPAVPSGWTPQPLRTSQGPAPASAPSGRGGGSLFAQLDWSAPSPLPPAAKGSPVQNLSLFDELDSAMFARARQLPPAQGPLEGSANAALLNLFGDLPQGRITPSPAVAPDPLAAFFGTSQVGKT
jgi:serine/threonine protein kinase